MRVSWALAILVTTSAFAASNPVAVTTFPPDWPHACPFKLERELLLPETKRILIVVDVPRGFAPKPEALDGLAKLAARYGNREARWVHLGDPGSPRMVWAQPSTPEGAPIKLRPVRSDTESGEIRLTQDQVELKRLFAEVPTCPGGPLAAEESFVFVRYLDEWGSSYGATASGKADSSCGGKDVPILYIAQGRIARKRPPGLSQVFLETRALIHEYGHALGLGTNPAHGWWMKTLPYTAGPHCVNRDCAVAVPSAMALLKGQMIDYCADCRRDIEQARQHWKTGDTFPPVPRLPQPDPASAVAKLKPYNFREGGDADRLPGFGKAVMPALVKRMSELPQGSEVSPRAYAATLAIRIIDSEDRKRHGLEGEREQDVRIARDCSRDILVWWSAEGKKFLAGDDWKLPSLLFEPH
jgi:hypothetical protein